MQNGMDAAEWRDDLLAGQRIGGPFTIDEETVLVIAGRKQKGRLPFAEYVSPQWIFLRLPIVERAGYAHVLRAIVAQSEMNDVKWTAAAAARL